MRLRFIPSLSSTWRGLRRCRGQSRKKQRCTTLPRQVNKMTYSVKNCKHQSITMPKMLVKKMPSLPRFSESHQITEKRLASVREVFLTRANPAKTKLMALMYQNLGEKNLQLKRVRLPLQKRKNLLSLFLAQKARFAHLRQKRSNSKTQRWIQTWTRDSMTIGQRWE